MNRYIILYGLPTVLAVAAVVLTFMGRTEAWWCLGGFLIVCTTRLVAAGLALYRYHRSQ